MSGVGLQDHWYSGLKIYCNDPEFWDRQDWANSLDLDQTASSV